jgi:hypothetical protein
MTLCRWSLVLLAALAVGIPLEGQEPETLGRTTIRGKVFDANTGAPLFGAFVDPTGLRTGFLTDTLGNFALTLPNGAAFHISAEQLGYETVELDVLRMDANRPIMIGMKPNPIMLEGVTALVDRFQSRRSFFSGSVRAYDRERLLAAGGQDALQFVATRTGVVRPCYGEIAVFQGSRHLEMYHPQDFYLIEVYDWGSQVRAYTNSYVERTVDRGTPLRPLIMGC